jgi:hypothetical protein
MNQRVEADDGRQRLVGEGQRGHITLGKVAMTWPVTIGR